MEHQELVKVIRQELYNDSDVLALILYGSVSRNEENPNSDIDFVVLNNASFFQKRHVVRDGITIEFFEMPLEFLKNLLKEKDAPIVQALADGIVLFDKNSTIDELIAEAKRIYEEGPNEYLTWGGNPERKLVKRAEITDIYNDLIDADNEIIFNYFTSSFIGEVVPLVIENNRLWYQSRKKTLDYLKSQEVEKYSYIETLLNSTCSLSERKTAAKMLVEKVLEPHGGIIKGDVVLFKWDL